MNLRTLLVLAVLGLAACRAQEGVPVAIPGPAPTAVPDAVVVELDSVNNSIAALLNDIDLSGTGLTITGVVVDQTLPPMAGAVATTDGNTVTFTPPATFVGVVTLQYAIADGTGAVSSAVIAVSVLPVAPPPVALPDTATVAQDSAATDIDVLANDVDLAGGGLTLDGATVTTSLPPGAHTVVVNAGQVRFTPAAGFVGAVVVGYTITDINGETAAGVLTVVVSPLALPVGLVAIPDQATVAQDSAAADHDVLANDVDFAGGGLTLNNVSVFSSQPAAVHAVSIVADQVRFTPAAAFAGIVVVSYTAEDVNGVTSNGLLTITVTPSALEIDPLALPDAGVASLVGGAQLFDVVANDINPAGGALTLTDASITAGLGTVQIVTNQVEFTPAGLGVVVIDYEITDVNGNTSTSTLTLVVGP
jgi:hypothetical protein